MSLASVGVQTRTGMKQLVQLQLTDCRWSKRSTYSRTRLSPPRTSRRGCCCCARTGRQILRWRCTIARELLQGLWRLYSVSSACTMLRHQVSLPFVAPLASPVLSAHLSSSRRSHKSLRVVDSALGRSSLLGGMIGLTGTDSAASAFACAGVVVCHVVVCGGARGQHGGEADLNRSHRLWHWRRDRELLIGAIGHGIAAGRDRELLIGAIVYGIGAGIASY